jgi:ferritin
MISKILVDEMNEQIMHEFYSAYFYLSMSAYAESANWQGFAAWLKVQAGEEQGHAMKFYEHIHDRGGRVMLKAIPQPPTEFKSLLDVFKQVYEHEQKVTARINTIYAAALKENDYASQVFLQWFINEQVEEEKSAVQIVDALTKIGESTNGLFALDHRLGKRGEAD